MSSLPAAVRGSQKPRVLFRPKPANEAAGLEAIELAESVGLILDPWQQLLVRVTLAEQADGRYAADTIAALVARQNGKGGWLEAVALHGMFLVRDPLTLWTAHQFKTSSEAFLRIRGWIDGSDDLRKCVSKMNAAHGEEGIELFGSSVRLRFVARSKSSGRGFSPQRIIFDEAQELSTAAQGALVPSMRAQRNRQSIYTGTVPGPDVNHPEVFTGLRDRGRKGTAKRFAWAEWSPRGSDDPVKAAAVDLDDPRNWAASNPALGYRVSLDALQSDRNELTDDDFGREALSIWPSIPDAGIGVFGPGVWDALGNESLSKTSPGAIGIEVSADRASGSIGAAVGGEIAAVAAVDERPGTGWLVAEAKRIQAEHRCGVAIHGSGAAADLIPALEAAGVRLTILKAGDYADACAGIWDRVAEARLQHPKHPLLDQAEVGATKRSVGDRWVWDVKKSATNVAMLKAVTLALWATNTEAPREFWGAIA
jgi:hypothetical protein